MKYSTLLLDVRDGVAHITFNRPDAANSLNRELGTDLMHAIMDCDADSSIRAVLLTGAGRFFCAGGDLKEFAGQGEHLAYHLKEVTTYLHTAIARMTHMDPPVVAAVNGFAAGAGMSIACACDFIIAGESTRFTTAYSQAGLTPDGSLTYFLPRIVGIKRALDLVLTSRVITAQEALGLGIVDRIVPDAQLLEQANALAVQLASGPTKALGVSKRLLHLSLNNTLESQMEQESQSIGGISRTSDSKEGVAAFLAKRKAQFKGQ